MVEAFNESLKLQAAGMTALQTSLTDQLKEVESKIGSTLVKFDEKLSNHDVLFEKMCKQMAAMEASILAKTTPVIPESPPKQLNQR